jgi:hypothetical protein
VEVIGGAVNAASQQKADKPFQIGTLVRRTMVFSNKLPVIRRKSNKTT